jgi:hypothetical protein
MQVQIQAVRWDMSRGLELFSTEVRAARPKVIASVQPNELYVPPFLEEHTASIFSAEHKASVLFLWY